MKSQNFKRARTAVSVFLTLFLSLSASLSYAEPHTLVPVGKTVGVTVNLKGISVINTAEFETTSGSNFSPAEAAGICAGDTILKINGRDINSATELSELTDKLGDEKMTVTVLHNGTENEVELTAAKDLTDGKYRLGIWIKDSSSGIGTLTYYDPETKDFGALGHGICTEDALTEINGGGILKAEVASVRHGEKGHPGELIGVFTESSGTLGDVALNTDAGIFGKLSVLGIEGCTREALPIASRDEVSEGGVTILSNISGTEVAEYTAEIQKINKDETASKGMIIKITDTRLLEKTGGIVQGMSGSPIIQNGKFVGAVTHVFVNDPTRGYGIFIENMLGEAERIE